MMDASCSSPMMQNAYFVKPARCFWMPNERYPDQRALYSSVVAFGVAALAVVLGIVHVLVGLSLRSQPSSAGPPGAVAAGACLWRSGLIRDG